MLEPVAQLDRALDCGSKGQRFESSQARFSGLVFSYCSPRKILVIFGGYGSL